MQDFTDKVAVVTGAASGIGRATATRFAEEGMRVVLADIETDPLERVASELADAGHEVLAVPTDVSSCDAVQALADRTVDAFGALHVVHNNAGVVFSGPIGRGCRNGCQRHPQRRILDPHPCRVEGRARRTATPAGRIQPTASWF